MKYRAKFNTPWCKRGEIFKLDNYPEQEKSICYEYKSRAILFDPMAYPDLFEPVEEKSNFRKMEQKFKFGDVVQISGEDSLKTKLYVVIDPEPDHEDDIGVMSELLEPMFFMQENLELREDKIALAPALIKYKRSIGNLYSNSGCLYESEEKAKSEMPSSDVYNTEFIRWPATPTSFVIVDREGK